MTEEEDATPGRTYWIVLAPQLLLPKVKQGF